MSYCHACGQAVESRWQVCPYCATQLKTSIQQNPQTTYSQLQSTPEFSVQNYPGQQYQNYPSQVIITEGPKSAKSLGFILLVIILGIAAIVVLSGILYVWSSSLSDDSNYTWSGDLNSEYQDIRWYDSEGDWEMYTSRNTLEGPSLDELSKNFSKINAEFQYGDFRFTYDASSSSEYEDFTVEGKQQIIKDVWFVLMTKVISEGEIADVDEGECFAVVHEDAYSGQSSWRTEVESTEWPSWCDSVVDL